MQRFDNVVFGQKAFVLNDKLEVLIIKRDKAEIYHDIWDIPGGKVTEGEDLFQALKRELKEEVNLDLLRVILVLSSSKFRGVAADAPLIFRNIYLVQAQGAVKLSQEHSEYKWVRLSDLANYNFPPDADFQAALLKMPEIINLLDLQKKYSLLV